MEMILRSARGRGPSAPGSLVPGSSSGRGYPLRPRELLLLSMPNTSSSSSDWLFRVEKKEEGEENCKVYPYGNHSAFLTDDKRAPHLGGAELRKRENQTQHCLVHSLNTLIQEPDGEGDEGDGEGDDDEGDDGDDSEGNNDDLSGIKLMSQS